MKFPVLRSLLFISALALFPAANATIASAETDVSREFAPLFEVFRLVKANYVDPTDDTKLVNGAIDGMLKSLDPHSSYETGTEYDTLHSLTEGDYGGLGLSVTLDEGVVRVIAATADTPAARAGIKAGDFITHINGQFVVGYSIDEAVDKMRGKPGTQVKLTIVRQGRDQPFDVTLTRAVIQIKPVKWEVKGDVGIISVSEFSRNATLGVRQALLGIDSKLGHHPLGYILDLRSDPGGLLDEAVGVSDEFLQSGEIVSQRGRDPRDIQRWDATPGDDAHGLPVIVLVDVGTASASEIVAGALQDHHRALIMGERSFGKGSVQSIIPMGDHAALRLTTARYYTPSGRSIQEGGIVPDIKVPQLTDPDYKSRIEPREADLRHHLINEAKVD
ncbi:MAG: S41 family peptidase, partial [Alphaproteobacteria bacterium]|nr:S41 family peptidase [Alphaproteobacteria bacterium]